MANYQHMLSNLTNNQNELRKIAVVSEDDSIVGVLHSKKMQSLFRDANNVGVSTQLSADSTRITVALAASGHYRQNSRRGQRRASEHAIKAKQRSRSESHFSGRKKTTLIEANKRVKKLIGWFEKLSTPANEESEEKQIQYHGEEWRPDLTTVFHDKELLVALESFATRSFCEENVQFIRAVRRVRRRIKRYEVRKGIKPSDNTNHVSHASQLSMQIDVSDLMSTIENASRNNSPMPTPPGKDEENTKEDTPPAEEKSENKEGTANSSSSNIEKPDEEKSQNKEGTANSSSSNIEKPTHACKRSKSKLEQCLVEDHMREMADAAWAAEQTEIESMGIHLVPSPPPQPPLTGTENTILDSDPIVLDRSKSAPLKKPMGLKSLSLPSGSKRGTQASANIPETPVLVRELMAEDSASFPTLSSTHDSPPQRPTLAQSNSSDGSTSGAHLTMSTTQLTNPHYLGDTNPGTNACTLVNGEIPSCEDQDESKEPEESKEKEEDSAADIEISKNLNRQISNIYNQFVDRRGAKQVNLSSITSATVKSSVEQLETLHSRVHIYDTAVDEILRLIRTSLLKGFYDSPEFIKIANSRPVDATETAVPVATHVPRASTDFSYFYMYGRPSVTALNGVNLPNQRLSQAHRRAATLNAQVAAARKHSASPGPPRDAHKASPSMQVLERSMSSKLLSAKKQRSLNKHRHQKKPQTTRPLQDAMSADSGREATNSIYESSDSEESYNSEDDDKMPPTLASVSKQHRPSHTALTRSSTMSPKRASSRRVDSNNFSSMMAGSVETTRQLGQNKKKRYRKSIAPGATSKELVNRAAKPASTRASTKTTKGGHRFQKKTETVSRAQSMGIDDRHNRAKTEQQTVKGWGFLSNNNSNQSSVTSPKQKPNRETMPPRTEKRNNLLQHIQNLSRSARGISSHRHKT